MAGKPVAIIMGSQSDWQTMKHAADTLAELGIGFEPLIVSAKAEPKEGGGRDSSRKRSGGQSRQGGRERRRQPQRRAPLRLLQRSQRLRGAAHEVLPRQVGRRAGGELLDARVGRLRPLDRL